MGSNHSPDPFCVLRGHTDIVNTTCFLTEDFLASGSADGELRVWNLHTSRSTALTDTHHTGVLSVEYLAAHNSLMSSGRDGLVKVWSIDESNTLTTSALTNVMASHAYHFCNSTVDPTLTHAHLIWSPAEDSSTALCWDVRTPRTPVAIYRPEESAEEQKHGLSMHMKFNPKDSQLLVGYENGSLVQYDMRSNLPVGSLQLFSDPVSSFDISVSGQIVAGSTGSHISFGHIDAAANGDGSSFQLIDLPRPGIGSVSLRSDEKIVATGGWDAKVRIYDVKRRRALALLRFHAESVYSVRFSADCKSLVTASKDHRIALFSLYPPK